MANHGDQATPLWITEFGWASTPPDGYCPPSWGCAGINVGPEAQAQLLTDCYNIDPRQPLRPGTYSASTGSTGATRHPTPELSGTSAVAAPAAGLLNYDRTPKPAYDAFEAFAGDTTPPQATITSGPDGTRTNDSDPQLLVHLHRARLDLRLPDRWGVPCALRLAVHGLPVAQTALTRFSVRAIDAAGNESALVSRSFTVSTAVIEVSGSTLTVTAATGAKDNFQIIHPPSSALLRVTDLPSGLPSGSYTGSAIRVGTGCTRSGDYIANCQAAGITRIKVVAGDGADQVTNSTALPSNLNGGPANDLLIGGSGDDILTGGERRRDPRQGRRRPRSGP